MKTVTMIAASFVACIAASLSLSLTSSSSSSLPRVVTVPRSFDLRPSPPDPSRTMRAITYAAAGDASVLTLDPSHPRPKLRMDRSSGGGGEVLIKVNAASLNPCDFKFRRNYAPNLVRPLPKIPGEDLAGVVVQVSPDVTKISVGDLVAAMMPELGSRWGSHAEYVVVREDLVAKIGNGTSFEDAAALPLVSLTVLQAFDKLRWQDRDGDGDGDGQRQRQTQRRKILIQAGSGGVGTFAIQYAKNVLGMYVATTASREKEPLLRELGADLVIDYRNERFEDVIQNYDAVLDTMSWSYEERTLGRNSNVLRRDGEGHYLNLLSSDWSLGTGGKEVTNGLVTWKNALSHKWMELVRPGSGRPSYHIVIVEPNGAQLQSVMDLLDKGTIRPVIDRQFKLEHTSSAYDYLERGHATGKVILTI